MPNVRLLNAFEDLNAPIWLSMRINSFGISSVKRPNERKQQSKKKQQNKKRQAQRVMQSFDTTFLHQKTAHRTYSA